MEELTINFDDDRHQLTNRTDGSMTNGGTFYLTKPPYGKPNWRLVIAIAIFTLGLGTAVVIVVVTSSNTSSSSSTTIHFPVSSSPLGVYRYASVAADGGRCSQIGTEMLARGGSAADAAIAACICTSVFNMHNAGVGGGFLMTVWDETNQTAYAVDARETAPAYATEAMFVNTNRSSIMGPYAIAVPGEMAGYIKIHKLYGRLPWKMLFQPTIELCNNGIEISAVLDNAIQTVLGRINNIKDQSPFLEMKKFLTNTVTNKPYKKGEIIKCPTLAKTFSRIAEQGGEDFYHGTLADDIIADLKDIGSEMTKEDLSSYKVELRTPVETVIQNQYRMFSVPPPGSGAILAFMLNILAAYNMTSVDSQNLLSYHRFVEASKFAYAKRLQMGDESFVNEMNELVKNLTDPTYGQYYRSLISDAGVHPTKYYLQDKVSEIRNHGTVHISVVDGMGNAVSVTSTINLYFGSGVLGKRTGIIFNNEMDDFSSPNETNYFNLPPSPENFIRPGKRPQSSMCPAVFLLPKNLTDSNEQYRVALVVGAAGGSRITSSTAYVAMRMLWFKENPKEAIDALRIHDQLLPETVYHETDMPAVIMNYLRQKGHVNQTDDEIMSVIQAIQVVENGTILANSDFRKNSFTDGF